MELQFILQTDRLLIEPLALADDKFIFDLLNTEGWIKFIGSRNITNEIEARTYIQKILGNPDITYWVAKLIETHEQIGIITYIKRDYLEHRDIGFAFLPNFAKQGYAYEATKAVLKQLIHEQKSSNILATTIAENKSSINLLNKIGFLFEKEIEVDNEKLQVYAAEIHELKV